VDLGDADAELASHLLAGEEAAVAQPIEATLEAIDQSHVASSSGREGLALPVTISERVELCGGLAIRTGIEQLIELVYDLGTYFAHERHGLRAFDAE
jgi:hypothetical protein